MLKTAFNPPFSFTVTPHHATHAHPRACTQVWKLLSGILHLGNVDITEVDTSEGAKAAIEDRASAEAAALAASMFGIKTDQLIDLVTVRHMTTHGQTIAIKLQVSPS